MKIAKIYMTAENTGCETSAEFALVVKSVLAVFNRKGFAVELVEESFPNTADASDLIQRNGFWLYDEAGEVADADGAIWGALVEAISAAF